MKKIHLQMQGLPLPLILVPYASCGKIHALHRPDFVGQFEFNSRKKQLHFAQREVDYISTLIQNLVPTQDLMEGGRYISVTHELHLTVIEGKVCNALTSMLSSRKCYVCGATPTEMNKLMYLHGRK